jgi:type IV secretion system protein VirB9
VVNPDAVNPDAAQAQVPAQPTDSCQTADCPPAATKPALPAGKSKSANSPSITIGKPAQRAIVESHNWAENPFAMPLRDSGGRVIFPFSESAPTIVCAPLRVCDIELQAGETVQGAPHIGDAIRWKVAPAVSGSDDHRVTHLIVKPTEAGLDTNLIIPTDRHTYHIRLVSSSERYVSSVAFDYPEEQQQQAWRDLTKTYTINGGGNTVGAMPVVAVDRLNFDYKIKVVKGKPTFRPLRAMDDGYHTYIAMNEDLPQQEAPALIGISPTGEEQMVNYRVKGNIYVVDGTLFKLALISGVGRHQQRIELTRDPCQNRGWLGICWDPKE